MTNMVALPLDSVISPVSATAGLAKEPSKGRIKEEVVC